MSLERERRRLRRAFGLALLAAAGPCAVQACAETKPPALADGGSADATTTDAVGEQGAEGSDVVPDLTPPSDAAESAAEAAAEAQADAENAEACAPLLELDGAFIDAPADAQVCGVVLPCGLPAGLSTSGCTVLMADASFGCRVVEEAGCTDDVFVPGDGAPIGVECPCDLFVGGGRRPSGMRARARVPGSTPLGAYLTRLAHEEALSIVAFERLRTELDALGAPQALVRAAAYAALDEVRHARTMAGLARTHGAEPEPVTVPARRKGAVFALALENATEGCVRETYAALLAHWQARHAPPGRLRRVFERIAVDETRHAALAWAIAAWAEERLSPAERRRILRAKRAEVRRLGQQLAKPTPAVLVQAAGVPVPRRHHALLTAMVEQLC